MHVSFSERGIMRNFKMRKKKMASLFFTCVILSQQTTVGLSDSDSSKRCCTCGSSECCAAPGRMCQCEDSFYGDYIRASNKCQQVEMRSISRYCHFVSAELELVFKCNSSQGLECVKNKCVCESDYYFNFEMDVCEPRSEYVAINNITEYKVKPGVYCETSEDCIDGLFCLENNQCACPLACFYLEDRDTCDCGEVKVAAPVTVGVFGGLLIVAFWTCMLCRLVKKSSKVQYMSRFYTVPLHTYGGDTASFNEDPRDSVSAIPLETFAPQTEYSTSSPKIKSIATFPPTPPYPINPNDVIGSKHENDNLPYSLSPTQETKYGTDTTILSYAPAQEQIKDIGHTNIAPMIHAPKYPMGFMSLRKVSASSPFLTPLCEHVTPPSPSCPLNLNQQDEMHHHNSSAYNPSFMSPTRNGKHPSIEPSASDGPSAPTEDLCEIMVSDGHQERINDHIAMPVQIMQHGEHRCDASPNKEMLNVNEKEPFLQDSETIKDMHIEPNIYIQSNLYPSEADRQSKERLEIECSVANMETFSSKKAAPTECETQVIAETVFRENTPPDSDMHSKSGS
ncbi:uncharacterized protein LOC143028174 [Oratosquilla oratoria]|uniref:uncharacterized protein LOC143028174 n=1 Tax=Oratosquilla oratoria TaxID=337810 RepID=UPI003F764A68